MKFDVDLDADSDPYGTFALPVAVQGRIDAITAQLNDRQRSLLIDEIALFDPVVWAEAKVGMPLDPWQKVVLRMPGDVALLSGRRSGKSTIAAIRAAHRVHAGVRLKRESTTLIVGPSLRQVVETMRTARALLVKSLSKDIFDIDNRLSIEIGGARIVGLPSDAATGRGFTSDFCIIEESQSLVDPDEIVATVAPTLATTNGTMWMIGTCFDLRDPLHAIFEGEAAHEERWTRFRIPSRWCPRIGGEFLEDQRRLLGQAIFEREYECKWTAPEHSMFDPNLLQGAMLPDGFNFATSAPPPLAGKFSPSPSLSPSLDAALAAAVLPR